ncbi:hypothetical protein TNCV_1465001 [Trichonephila clavipes]|nr:hypothetical protein TNCV_1465001 [Trichonephila clavipes]
MQPKAKHSLRAQAQLMRTETVETFELVKVKQKLLDIRAEKERSNERERERCASRRYLLNIIVKLIYSPLVSMEIPLRTAYSQAGRCGMQPKAKHSLRAQAQLMRTETVETFELVKVKQKLLDIRAEKERSNERERERHEQRAMNINRYTNAELADIHFNYVLYDGNRRVAIRLHGERYLTRRQPNHRTFARVHQNLAEHGSFRATIDNMSVKSEMDLVA